MSIAGGQNITVGQYAACLTRENRRAMAIEPRPLINDYLLHQLEETARAQNRQPEEVVGEALRRYLDDQKWERLVRAGERRAKEKGLPKEDVPQLIEKVRCENPTASAECSARPPIPTQYVSALTTGRGKPHEFLQLARAGKVRLAKSADNLDEVGEVLERKFDWPSSEIAGQIGN
jgi:predicted transcriptional regulator